MKDGVILCTSVEQGAKIIEYWKSLGVDTFGYDGVNVHFYYGVFKGVFGYFLKPYVEKNNIPILTLPDETTTPELPEVNFEGIEMEVWDNHSPSYIKKRKIIAKVNKFFIDSVGFSWDNARPIQQKVKVTKEQIAEAFNTTVDNLEIE